MKVLTSTILFASILADDDSSFLFDKKYVIKSECEVDDALISNIIVECEVRGGIWNMTQDSSLKSRELMKTLRNHVFTMLGEEVKKNRNSISVACSTVILTSVAEVNFAGQDYAVTVYDFIGTGDYVFRRKET